MNQSSNGESSNAVREPGWRRNLTIIVLVVNGLVAWFFAGLAWNVASDAQEQVQHLAIKNRADIISIICAPLEKTELLRSRAQLTELLHLTEEQLDSAELASIERVRRRLDPNEDCDPPLPPPGQLISR